MDWPNWRKREIQCGLNELIATVNVNTFDKLFLKYVLKMVSFPNKERTKEPKVECAYILGQTS